MWMSLRIAAAMHVLELVLSCVLLQLGWMEEANPIAAAVYAHTGTAGLVAFKMFFLICAVAAISKAIHQRSAIAAPATAMTLGTGVLAVAMLLLAAESWI